MSGGERPLLLLLLLARAVRRMARMARGRWILWVMIPRMTEVVGWLLRRLHCYSCCWSFGWSFSVSVVLQFRGLSVSPFLLGYKALQGFTRLYREGLKGLGWDMV
jgi:hypothetical protein